MNSNTENMHNYTINGKCPPGCHVCCSNLLPLSSKEINDINRYISTHNVEINNPNTVFSGYMDVCPFINTEGKCGIYPVRPEICSYYFCNPELKTTQFTHTGKHIVNMLLTFKPGAYTPSDTPDVKKIDMLYQTRKVTKDDI